MFFLLSPRRWLFLVRLFLAVTFLVYGSVKLSGGQFHYGDFVLDSRTTDGPTLVWTFFGYSPVYGKLIGLAEVGAGLLLLLPRTRFLGALVLFPITANITVMDFCFDFPAVKYFSLLLTCLCGLLLAADYRRLLALLGNGRWQEKTAAAPEQRRFGCGHVLLLLVGLPAGLFLVNLVVASLPNDPVPAAMARCRAEGWRDDQLVFQSWRADGWSGINRKGYVVFRTKGQVPMLLLVRVERPHSFVGWQVVDYHETLAVDDGP